MIQYQYLVVFNSKLHHHVKYCNVVHQNLFLIHSENRHGFRPFIRLCVYFPRSCLVYSDTLLSFCLLSQTLCTVKT